jgi:hypothetical protein
MASPDQNLSTLLQRIKNNKFNIKNMNSDIENMKSGIKIMKFDELESKLLSLPKKNNWQSHAGSLVGAGSAITLFLMKGMLTGFYQLAPEEMAIILFWNSVKPYFINTKLRKLLDKPLTFVTKQKLDRNLVPLAPDAIDVKSLMQLKEDNPQWAAQIEVLKKSPELNKAKGIELDDVKIPEPLTFDQLILLLQDQKRAEQYFKNEKNPGVYFDLSPESKKIIGEALVEVTYPVYKKHGGFQQFYTKSRKFFKENKLGKFISDVALPGGLGGAYFYNQIKKQEVEDLKNKILQEDVETAKEEAERQRPKAPNPLDTRKKNPRDFGG